MSRREAQHRVREKKAERGTKPAKPAKAPVEKRQSPFVLERALRRSQRTPGPTEVPYKAEPSTASHRPNEDAYLAALPSEEAAQELAFQALEARSPQERNQLAARALALDPHCIDAKIIQLTAARSEPAKLVADLQALLAAAEARMGPEFFTQYQGHLWSRAAARPYLRARHLLATILLNEENLTDAAAAFESMLAQDREDNLGGRYPLLGIFLETENIAGAQKVFEQFPGETGAAFSWAKAAYHALRKDVQAGRKFLREAMEANEYVLDMLVGIEEIPETISHDYEEGSFDEAGFIVLQMGGAWLSETAQEFLHEEAKLLMDQGYPKLRHQRDDEEE